MAGLEAVLKISAKDDAGPALAKVKAQIAELDKQIAVFDKISAAVGKITKATDPMVRSIDASTRALRPAGRDARTGRGSRCRRRCATHPWRGDHVDDAADGRSRR